MREIPDPVRAFSDLICSLVDDPLTVDVVTERAIDQGVIFRVTTHSGDIGEIVGVNGRTARSLRLLLQAVGTARGERYYLDIRQGAQDV